ncbi:YbaN family protein [Arabiibacter massiliensis]|uniref:YbaN family protein n=1 Tax=Arabiibacter massiliensis TaxID=1870985 RepID=UPI0009B9F864|nr:YbaN family protein [Arabiibacter massiliensis]
MSRISRILMLAGAWIACILGCVGVFIPVLPTTPLLLLATFLFAKSSPRCHAWIVQTKVYRTYVAAFKQAGGIPLGTKARILAVSFAVMGLSAWFVRKPVVWAVLAAVSAFLLWLMFVRIPTIAPEHVRMIRQLEEAE